MLLGPDNDIIILLVIPAVGLLAVVLEVVGFQVVVVVIAHLDVVIVLLTGWAVAGVGLVLLALHVTVVVSVVVVVVGVAGGGRRLFPRVHHRSPLQGGQAARLDRRGGLLLLAAFLRHLGRLGDGRKRGRGSAAINKWQADRTKDVPVIEICRLHLRAPCLGYLYLLHF